MQVLDTDTMPAGDRAEAFQATVSMNCSSSAAIFEDESTLRAKMHVFELGPARVFTIDATGTTLRRTPKMARQVNECDLVLALPMRTDNHMMWEREDRFYGPRDMMLVDVSAPYVYGWRGEGASYALHVDVEELALPMDTVRLAMPRLHASPLYPMVRDHVVQVTTQAHRVEGTAAAFHLGVASVELMRALVASAAEDALAEAALQASLPVRVQTYVRQHLRDPDLGPAKVAAVHGLSVRTLYSLYETLGVSLEQSIIEQRLAGARADLAAPRRPHATIAATARAWGFPDPTFFSHRFRRAYGMTPRQWVTAAQAAQNAQAGDGPPPA